MTRRMTLLAIPFAVVLLLAAAQGRAASPTTRLASLRSNGDRTNGDSSSASVSADGRYVAFESDASNLVAGDSNASGDVFVHDMVAGTTVIASVRSSGAIGDAGSGGPFISANGRFVGFESDATNLVKGDTNGQTDVFVHDVVSGKTTRVSVRSSGVQGDGSSREPSLSVDGRYVAFGSYSTNLVNGDTNGQVDIFVHDLSTGRTIRASVSSGGVQTDNYSTEPMISGDGKHVVFGSDATTLVPNDSNGATDIFWRDTATGKTKRVSVSSAGAQADGSSVEASVSADGGSVAFTSSATNLVASDTNLVEDMFVHDMKGGRTKLVSVSTAGVQGDSYSGEGHISAGGGFVAFGSQASNLVGSDTNSASDVFLRDLAAKRTRLLSVNTVGVQGDGGSSDPSISPDGSFVAFESGATNLVGGDINGFGDIFERSHG